MEGTAERYPGLEATCPGSFGMGLDNGAAFRDVV
jgi:hypothetical protein